MVKKMKRKLLEMDTAICNFSSVTLSFTRVNMLNLIKLLADINVGLSG